MKAPSRGRLAERVTLTGAVTLIAYLALVPLCYLLWSAFTDGGQPSLEHFRDAYSRDGLGSMTVQSLLFALGSTAVSVIAGSAIAFVVVRTDVPLRRSIFALAFVPLIVPGVLYTIAWIFLASPRVGALRDVLPFDAFGMTGMIVVEGLHLAPLVLVLMALALRSMDGTLEEAALMSGAGRWTIIRRVTLPLVSPAFYAAVLVMMIRAIESFEVPALLGIPGDTWVFTSRIWQALDGFPADTERAAAYAIPLLVGTVLGVFAYTRLAGSAARFEVVRGTGVPARPIRLGRWRWPCLAGVSAYLALAVVAPIAVLVYVSLQPHYETPSLSGLSDSTGTNYSSLFSDGATMRAFGNSMLVSVGAATAITVVMTVAAWLVVRGRARARWMVDALASLPLVIPGLVLGLAMLLVYVRLPIPIYGTLWLIFLAYFTRFMPYGMRYAASALHQISGELEEAARTSGATWGQTLRRIVAPLIAPALIAGWLYVIFVSIRELSASVLLFSPGHEVITVRILALYDDGRLTEVAALGVVLTAALACLAGLTWRLGGRFGAWTR